jgi:hypothetical protein
MLKITHILTILCTVFFEFINLIAAERPVTTDQNRVTLSDRISGLRHSQAFPELAVYAAYNCQVSIEYMERNWAGKKAYIEKVNLKSGNDHFIRVRIYLLSIHPLGIDCGIIIQYFRESWYDKDDELFIDEELHPYSQHKKALVDLNLFWNAPEYVGKTYKVNNTVLRNMTQTEKETIIAYADHLLFVLNY